MSFHRGDPTFIRLFVTGIHQHNIDISVGQDLLNNYAAFVEYMRENNEYLPDAPSIKVIREFYKHQAPFTANRHWTPAKEERLKNIKQWLIEEYNSRLPLQVKNEQTEDLDIDIDDDENIPPKISSTRNNNIQNSLNSSAENNGSNEIIQNTSSEKLNKQNNLNKDDIIIINRKKKRKYSKRELDSDSESEEIINDFDLSFKAIGSSQQNMRNRMQQRRQEEQQIQYSRNQQRLQAVRNNTGKIVADLINSAIPTIIENSKINEILTEERTFKQKQEKINNAIIQNLKKFKNSTEQYFGIIDAKLNQIINGMAPTTSTRPAKRRRIDIDYDFDC